MATRKKRDTQSTEVLVASADAAFATSVEHQIQTDGFPTERCHDVKCVLRRVGVKHFDIVVLDLELHDGADMDLVSFVRQQSPTSRLILVFDRDEVDRAIDGIRQGAFFYLPKSTPASDVAMIARKAAQSISQERSVQKFEQEAFEEMLGKTPAMRRVIEVIRKVAPTNSTVLLQGESGVGKDLLASTIHRLSNRHENPFIAVNCAALPETLLESELFGHKKGAFTGADSDKRGLFEEADGGTVFLDEIGDMALITQAKLLRVLQNGEIRRVGDSTSRRVNVRIIAATNKNLEEMVRDRQFREDLYFRLNVVQVYIPPLRDRPEIIPRLVQYFTNRAAGEHGKIVEGYDEAAQALMQNYSYPGNVRELQSIVEHAVIMCEDGVIRPHDLPQSVIEGRGRLLALPQQDLGNGEDTGGIKSLREVEEEQIRRALEALDYNQTEAAQELGISRSTLWRKMKDYGIQV